MTFGVIWVSAHPTKFIQEVLLVFQATNTKTKFLIEVALVHNRLIVNQIPAPGIVTKGVRFRRRPKETEATHTGVVTITDIDVTSGKTGKTTFISCTCIWAIPMD